jgi:hypothetical protein
MISRKLRVFAIALIFFFLALFDFKVVNYLLIYKKKKARMKTNTILHTYYILIDTAYCCDLKFMGDIVNWVVI